MSGPRAGRFAFGAVPIVSGAALPKVPPGRQRRVWKAVCKKDRWSVRAAWDGDGFKDFSCP